MAEPEHMHLPDEAATLAYGAAFAERLRQDDPVVCLHGELGAGKTTFVRGVLRGLGHGGSVKSPTYTLLEPYVVGRLQIYHFDFYRVNDPEELTFIGLDELVHGPGIKLIEWAERVPNKLPTIDWHVTLRLAGEGRDVSIQTGSSINAT